MESKEFLPSHNPNYQPELDELIAIAIACRAYINDEAKAETPSNWLKASLMEQTGCVSGALAHSGLLRQPRQSYPKKPAQAGRWLITTLTLTMLLSHCQSALAWWPFKHHHHEDTSVDSPEPAPVINSFRQRPLPIYRQPVVSTPAPTRAPSIQTRGQPLYLPNTISVAIATNVDQADITALDGAQLVDATTGATVGALAPRSRWSACSNLDSIALNPKPSNLQALNQLAARAGSGSQISQPTLVPVNYVYPTSANVPIYAPIYSATNPAYNSQGGFYIVPPIAGGIESVVAFNGRLYRGKLLLKPNIGVTQGQVRHFNVINVVDIEDYLQSVVPSEMPSGWPAEALKAQAIAARSYAYANLGKNAKSGFDVRDNTEDQMYLGVQSEARSTNSAVQGTRGLIMSYDGKPICAYFHATSGGFTDLAENVWTKPLPYLRSVPDYDDDAPLFTWSRNFSVTQLESTIGQGLGLLLDCEVVSRSPTQRVKHVLILGLRDGKVLSGENMRGLLKLPSSNFNICPATDGYVFAGRGFGHGLGLSQWGAKSLAEHGYNAAQILTYYYKDVIVEPLAGSPGT